MKQNYVVQFCWWLLQLNRSRIYKWKVFFYIMKQRKMTDVWGNNLMSVWMFDLKKYIYLNELCMCVSQHGVQNFS